MASKDPITVSLTALQLRDMQPSLPDWTVDTSANVVKLIRTFSFKNFADALAFTDRVGGAAEEADHHPLISLTWGEARVEWWSHSAGGITQNDIDMARSTDGIYASTRLK